MAHAEKALTLAPGAWSEVAAYWMQQAMHGTGLEEVKKQIERGVTALFYIQHGADTVGAFALRVDTVGGQSEGVIVAAAAKLEGVDFVATVLPAIEDKFINCDRIRYHTENPALARKLARAGYQAAEIVCFKSIKK